MEENSTYSILIDLLAKETGVSVEQISETTQLSSLVTDSLELTSLILAIEEKFPVDMENLPRATTVQDIVKLIEAKK